jgi:hypothetical protein
LPILFIFHSLPQWQLSGRSLLNRDAQGNYKFAHRSIMEYLFVKRLLQGHFDCSGFILTDQMKRFLIEIIAAKSDHFSIDTVLEFLLKIEVSIDYEDRITLQRNKQNSLAQVPNDNNLEELINAQEDFLLKLNEFSEILIYLITESPYFHFRGDMVDDLKQKISEINNTEFLLKLQLRRLDLVISDTYMKQVFELLIVDLSKNTPLITMPKAISILQKSSIEVGRENELGEIIALYKEITNRLLEKGIETKSSSPIETQSSSLAEIDQDIKRFVELYGINGVISFSFINQSPFCKIEPLYPNFSNFILRINTSAL